MPSAVLYVFCLLLDFGFYGVHSFPTVSSQVESGVNEINTFKSQTSNDDPSVNIHPVMRALNSGVVGFTVKLGSPLTDVALGSTVVFDTVLYNAGNGYDRSTGVFTCPRSGLYLFYVNVEPVDETTESAVKIDINGSIWVVAGAERYAAGHDSTGGNMLIQHILKGDRVWVETYARDNQDLYNGLTSFSGVLIQST